MDYQKNPHQYQDRTGLPDQSGRNRGYRVNWPASSVLSCCQPVQIQSNCLAGVAVISKPEPYLRNAGLKPVVRMKSPVYLESKFRNLENGFW